MTRPRLTKDVLAGGGFVAAGAAFAIASRAYPMGDGARPGPGAFPFWLGVLLAGLGLAIVLSGLRQGARGERLEPWDIRAILSVLGGVAAFGLALPRLGLVISILLLVGISSLGNRPVRWREAALNAACLSGACVMLFVVAIKLPLPLWPAVFRP